MKVKNIIISEQAKSSENYKKFLEITKKKKINIIIVNKGDKIIIEKNLYFYILWPDKDHFISDNFFNNNSMVCKLYYYNFSMLLTGDIEEKAENKILEQYGPQLLNSTILKVAHHRF